MPFPPPMHEEPDPTWFTIVLLRNRYWSYAVHEMSSIVGYTRFVTSRTPALNPAAFARWQKYEHVFPRKYTNVLGVLRGICARIAMLPVASASSTAANAAAAAASSSGDAAMGRSPRASGSSAAAATSTSATASLSAAAGRARSVASYCPSPVGTSRVAAASASSCSPESREQRRRRPQRNPRPLKTRRR